MVAVALAHGKSTTVSAQAELAASPMRRFGIVRLGQPAAITLAVLVICIVMALISEPFRSYDNLYNDSRNFGFVAIMGMGQMLVIITGGIDLSVGSVMGLVGIATGLTLQAGYPLWVGVGEGMGVAVLRGLINGYAIARFKLSPFVVTLIMLSVARSQALVLSNNKMIYQFGPDEKLFGELGGGSMWHWRLGRQRPRNRQGAGAGEGSQDSGRDLGQRPAARRQGAARRLHRHGQRRGGQGGRPASDGGQAKWRHLLHPDRRTGCRQHERPHQGHDRDPACRQMEAGCRLPALQ